MQTSISSLSIMYPIYLVYYLSFQQITLIYSKSIILPIIFISYKEFPFVEFRISFKLLPYVIDHVNSIEYFIIYKNQL